MLFNDRTKGKEADAISKSFLCLPEFGGMLGWQYASDRLLNRGFPRLDLGRSARFDTCHLFNMTRVP